MSLTSEQFDQWVTLLRTQPKRQCYGTIRQGDRCCVQGVLAFDVLGVQNTQEAYNAVDAAVGQEKALRVQDLNDLARATFPEIADYLEEHRDEYVA